MTQMTWSDAVEAIQPDVVRISTPRGSGTGFLISNGKNSTVPVIVIGVVSSYMPNRATGEVLPGLSVVRDVKQFHDLAPTFASLDQAREAAPAAQPPAPQPGVERPGENPVRRTT